MSLTSSFLASSSSPDNTKANSSPFKRLCRKLSPKHNSSRKSSSSISLDSDSIVNVEAEAITRDSRESFNEELVQRVFNYFDENGDGRISASELMSCMKAAGGRELSLAEAELAVESSDSDGDGMLDFEEFGKLLEGSEGESKEEELRGAFGMYTEESGEITPKSLKRMLSRLGQSTSVDNCKAMIRKFDLNGDGVLNFDEFRIMMH